MQLFSECVSAMSSFNKCMSVMNARLQSLRPFIHRQRNYLKIFSDSISGIRHSQAPAGRFGSLCRYGFFRNIAPSDEPVVSRHRRPLRTRSGFLGKSREQGIFSYAENVSRIRRPGGLRLSGYGSLPSRKPFQLSLWHTRKADGLKLPTPKHTVTTFC